MEYAHNHPPRCCCVVEADDYVHPDERCPLCPEHGELATLGECPSCGGSGYTGECPECGYKP